MVHEEEGGVDLVTELKREGKEKRGDAGVPGCGIGVEGEGEGAAKLSGGIQEGRGRITFALGRALVRRIRDFRRR